MRRSALPLALLVSFPISIVSCKSGGGSSSAPTGTHHQYVIDSMTMPQTTGEFALDLDGDGIVDNQFQNILSTLMQAGNASDFDFQSSVDASVLRGDTLLLGDLQATTLVTATRAGFWTYDGATPNPAPCTVQTDLATCGQHLQGTGTFTVAAGSSTTGFVEGSIAAGTFEGGPGNLLLQLDLLGSPLSLQLKSARAEITSITPTSIGNGILAGGISSSDVTNYIEPVIHSAVVALIARDCTGGAPPSCGCLGGSTGDALMGIFDANGDCAVTLNEFQTDGLTATIFAPDFDADADGTYDSLSLGVGFTAVAASYPQP